MSAGPQRRRRNVSQANLGCAPRQRKPDGSDRALAQPCRSAEKPGGDPARRQKPDEGHRIDRQDPQNDRRRIGGKIARRGNDGDQKEATFVSSEGGKERCNISRDRMREGGAAIGPIGREYAGYADERECAAPYQPRSGIMQDCQANTLVGENNDEDENCCGAAVRRQRQNRRESGERYGAGKAEAEPNAGGNKRREPNQTAPSKQLWIRFSLHGSLHIAPAAGGCLSSIWLRLELPASAPSQCMPAASKATFRPP
jgi:hypothetical protein